MGFSFAPRSAQRLALAVHDLNKWTIGVNLDDCTLKISAARTAHPLHAVLESLILFERLS
jgi:hypothetical protein